jgi:hypothetical protein
VIQSVKKPLARSGWSCHGGHRDPFNQVPERSIVIALGRIRRSGVSRREVLFILPFSRLRAGASLRQEP